MMKPPTTIATIGQLIPEPVVDSEGKPGVFMAGLGGGKLSTVN